MRFKYTFQKIVDLKSNEKTQAEWVLSGAIGHLREEEESLSTLFSEKNSVETELVSAAQHTTASELMNYQYYLDHLNNRIRCKTADVRLAEKDVVEKRGILSSKMVEEKVWDQARNKAYLLHQATVLKKEQEVLDEMATMRHKASHG
ncbi:flagellar export protein FliJ [Paenibacillus mesotrionivorans]|jgi:flagellar FliJ protein|uniref:Flagellar export protein FliJ n=1 Tax=Paenibacillus mesotrionivorans TaxID=3160968 RepID=A0ACC7NRC0_9BACL